MGIREQIRGRAGDAFGATFFVYLSAAAASAGLTFFLGDEAVFGAALARDFDVIVMFLPKMTAALLIAGFTRVLLPRDLVERWLGGSSGWRGVVIGVLAGVFTPGGPITAFTMIATLKAAGADRGVLVAYAISWALLGVQRILVWEWSLMGPDFALTRYLVSAPLPFLAAVLARRIPIRLDVAPQRPR